MANIIHIDRTSGAITLSDLSGVLKAPAGVVTGSAVHADLGSIGADDHHNQAHVLNGSDHTVSGLTTGHVLQATGATTFGFAAVPGLHDPVTVTALPLTLSGQAVTFNYDTGDFQLSGNNLQVKDGGIAHDFTSGVHQAVGTAASPTFAGITIADGGLVSQASVNTTAVTLCKWVQKGSATGGDMKFLFVAADETTALGWIRNGYAILYPVHWTTEIYGISSVALTAGVSPATVLKVTPTGVLCVPNLTCNNTVRADTAFNVNGADGLSTTLTLDDGANWRITMVFSGGILTSKTTAASSGTPVASWS